MKIEIDLPNTSLMTDIKMVDKQGQRLTYTQENDLKFKGLILKKIRTLVAVKYLDPEYKVNDLETILYMLATRGFNNYWQELEK